ncbi:MAG: sugar ABC transporter permease [Chloroflexota bacterium]
MQKTKRKTSSPSILNRISDNEAILGYLFLLPSLIGFIAFYAVPAVRAVFISFTEWNLLTEATFVGFENYVTLWEDERFWRSMRVTLLYVVWNIPLQTMIAIIMAVMLERMHNTASAVFRGLMILPWLMPNVVVGLLWLWMLDPSLGIVNVGLEAIGLPSQSFLGAPEQAIASIAGINIWRHAGYNAILIFAGLKTIPKGLYEAASIAGATRLRQFFTITIPLLRPVLVFVLVTSVIGSFQIFDTIAVTTSGGPAGSTRVIIYYITDEIFNRRISMGTATAASVVLFSILISVTLIQLRFLQADQSDLADYQ